MVEATGVDIQDFGLLAGVNGSLGSSAGLAASGLVDGVVSGGGSMSIGAGPGGSVDPAVGRVRLLIRSDVDSGPPGMVGPPRGGWSAGNPETLGGSEAVGGL